MIRHFCVWILVLAVLLPVAVSAQAPYQRQRRFWNRDAGSAQGSGGFAQGGGQQGGRQGGPGLGKILGLTMDQIKQIKQIRTQTRMAVLAAQNDPTLTRRQRMQRVRAIRQSAIAEIEGLLTDDQRMRFEALLAQRRAAAQENQQQQQPNASQPGPDAAP